MKLGPDTDHALCQTVHYAHIFRRQGVRSVNPEIQMIEGQIIEVLLYFHKRLPCDRFLYKGVQRVASSSSGMHPPRTLCDCYCFIIYLHLITT